MKLYTIKEAAAEIKMSQGWIKKAIREKELPVIRFGRSVRIFEGALEYYCRKHVVNPEGTVESRDGSLKDSIPKPFQEKSAGYRP